MIIIFVVKINKTASYVGLKKTDINRVLDLNIFFKIIFWECFRAH